MSNFTLSEVEGGSTIPRGSLVEFPPTYPSVFELDGTIYSTDNVPGRVIPNFDTLVAKEVKGMVNDPTLCPVNISTTGAQCAGIANDGTMMRAVIDSTTVTLYIDRKLPSESLYTPVLKENVSVYASVNGSLASVVTDSNGTWVIAIGTVLAVSKNNGETWAILPLSDGGITTFTDLKYSSVTGTYILCASAGYSETYSTDGIHVFRSKDGVTWSARYETPVSTVAFTTGTTWVGIKAGSAVTHISTDDGVTWTTGVSLPFTPTVTNYQVHMNYSAGRYYISNIGSLYTGTSLASVVSLGTVNGLAFTVDDVGNAYVMNSVGAIAYVNNGAAPTIPSTKARVENFTTTGYCTMKWANGTLVFKDGAYISVTDLLANTKSCTCQVIRGLNSRAPKLADVASNGTSLINLNSQSYLRSTDGWKTVELRTFDLQDQTNVAPSGCATDNNGTWIMTYNGAALVYRSTDDGLTWTRLSPDVGPGVTGVVGGTSAGKFLITTTTNVAYYTNNSFTTISTITGSGNDLKGGCPASDGETAYFVTHNSSDTTKVFLNKVNLLTGTLSTYTYNRNVGSYGTAQPLLQYGSTIIYHDLIFMGGGLGVSTTKYKNNTTAILTFKDGVISSKSPFGTSTNDHGYMVGDNLMMRALLANRENVFATIGIKDMSLPSTTFIKVT